MKSLYNAYSSSAHPLLPVKQKPGLKVLQFYIIMYTCVQNLVRNNRTSNQARPCPIIGKNLFRHKAQYCKLLLLIVLFPVTAFAHGFKFKIRNTAKTDVAVFYKISQKSGEFKVKSLLKLKAGEEKIKEISVNKGDTIAFYGQDAEDQTSVMIRKSFSILEANAAQVTDIPIVIPEKQTSNFESLEGLSVKLETDSATFSVEGEILYLSLNTREKWATLSKPASEILMTPTLDHLKLKMILKSKKKFLS